VNTGLVRSGHGNGCRSALIASAIKQKTGWKGEKVGGMVPGCPWEMLVGNPYCRGTLWGKVKKKAGGIFLKNLTLGELART